MNIPDHIKNRLLQNRLDDLIKHARDNEKKQAQYETFGFEIIDANTPAELRYLLLSKLKARFHLQDVVLCLIDQQKDTARLFLDQHEKSRMNHKNRLLILDSVKDSACIGTLSKTPLTGVGVITQYPWMIAGLKNKDHFKSAAYLPLMRGIRITGALLLLSQDAQRYAHGIGTLFLQKLSSMAAVAVENCLNQQRLKEISYQDVLTQVYNRRYFDLRFKDEIARSLRWRDDLVCMFLDVDHFKRINDTYGHQTGDNVLVHVASLIKTQVRACDIAARYGGEEFVVALPATSLQSAHEIAERLRQAVCSNLHSFQDKQFQVSISIGMANLQGLNLLLQHNGQDCESIGTMLLARADAALYRAKEEGRNQVAVFSTDDIEQ
ncbi:MAG: sensor domain-containing diguanylate cyclase [Nitrosomonas sp.]|nr:sensor domain-containing diguanylate cyclase [Nitrosomonas sp.]MCW5607199.1 sensor domain-containing diguanylate cyclase [Nitrosomonas sp.]